MGHKNKSLQLFLLSIFILLGMGSFNVMASKSEQVKIKQGIVAYEKALNSSNVANVISVYSKNGVFMPSGSTTAIGWGAVKSAYQDEFEKIDLDVKAIIDEIDIGSDMAFARTRSEGKLTILTTKQTKSTHKYRALFLFKKENKTWKISDLMVNFNG